MRTLDPTRSQVILDAAAQLFARSHYHEVRMEDIAAQAKVAKGTLYRYFEDKEDLYLALTVDSMQRLFEESQDKAGGPGEPECKLRAFVKGIFCFYKRQPYLLDLVARVETSRSAASAAALESMRKQYRRLLVSLVKELDAGGRYVAADPELAAIALQGMMRGVLRTVAPPWPDHIPDWLCNQFLNGLTRTV